MGIQTNRKTYVMIAMYINVILMYNRWLINPYKPVGWRLGFAPFFLPKHYHGDCNEGLVGLYKQPLTH